MKTEVNQYVIKYVITFFLNVQDFDIPVPIFIGQFTIKIVTCDTPKNHNCSWPMGQRKNGEYLPHPLTTIHKIYCIVPEESDFRSSKKITLSQ